MAPVRIVLDFVSSLIEMSVQIAFEIPLDRICQVRRIVGFEHRPVAPFYNLEPIVTTAFAALLFGEILTPNQYAGGGIVLAALVVSSLLGKRENRA